MTDWFLAVIVLTHVLVMGKECGNTRAQYKDQHFTCETGNMISIIRGQCLCADKEPCIPCYNNNTSNVTHISNGSANEVPGECGRNLVLMSDGIYTCREASVSIVDSSCLCADGSQCTKCSEQRNGNGQFKYTGPFANNPDMRDTNGATQKTQFQSIIFVLVAINVALLQ